MKKLILHNDEHSVLRRLLDAVPPAQLPRHIPDCTGADLRFYGSLLKKVQRSGTPKFQQDLANNEMSIDVVNARRFAAAVQQAMRLLEQEARCYGLTDEGYYLDVQEHLERMHRFLTERMGGQHEC
jgi:hypothetical protein